MNRVAKQKGFTLIELLLAMAFISVLLLAIAMTILQIGSIYNRGMTLKEVNQAARSISDDIRRNLTTSEAFSVESKFITHTGGGRLCLGKYSYVWNTGRALQFGDQNLTSYADTSLTDKVRFVKIPDPAGIYCAMASNGAALLYKDIRAEDTDRGLVVEMLRSGDRNLALHQFDISSGTNSQDGATAQQLYYITFTIGTGDTVAIESDGSACLPPSDPNSDLQYCTVQQFTLVLRAGNRVN